MSNNKQLSALVGLGLAWLSLLGGCYDSKQLNAFLTKPRSPVSGVDYRICPPDVLYITSLHVQEINALSQQVRPDGKINLPLVGEVFVAGMTPREVEAALASLARQYYSKVSVTVEVQSYNSRKYFVFGQVSRPGPLPWTGHDTLLDALAMSQPNPLAWPERIIIVRGDDPKSGGHATTRPYKDGSYSISGVRAETPDRPRYQLVVNMQAMVESGDMSNNVLLMPDDIVYVQPNPLAKLGLALEQVLFPMRAAGDGLRTLRIGTDDVRWIGRGMPADTNNSTGISTTTVLP